MASSSISYPIFATQNNQENIQAFKHYAEKIQKKASEYSVELHAYHKADLPLFSALSLEQQQNALIGISAFWNTLQATESAGHRLDNQSQLLWHALMQMELLPPSDLFLQLQSDDVIEIYSMDGLQIWRNFNFLKNCSYTIEEIYSIEWNLRYRRDPSKVDECINKVTQLLTGQTPDVFHAQISAHTIEETLSLGRFKLEVSHDWLARLKNTHGQLSAWMGISKSRLVKSRDLPFGLRRSDVDPAPAPHEHQLPRS